MTVLAPAWSPTTSLLLLLLLLSPCLWGARGCSWRYSPISSTFSDKILKLTQYLLQDYPVTVPSNLQDDEICGALWRLVLAQRWMGRLQTVAGSEMQKLLDEVNTEIYFVTSCAFQDTSRQLHGLKLRITSTDFTSCLELQCQPDTTTLLPPRTPGAWGSTEPPSPAASPLLLLLLPALVAPLLAAAWCLRRRRRGHPGPVQPRSGRGAPGGGRPEGPAALSLWGSQVLASSPEEQLL